MEEHWSHQPVGWLKFNSSGKVACRGKTHAQRGL